MPPVATTRPITEEERAMLLEPRLKLFDRWTGVVSAACMCALTFVTALLTAAFLPYDVVLPGAIGAACLACAMTYLRIQRRERKNHWRETERMTRESEAGYVKSTVYTISDAVAVEEQEDEGLSYYLLLDDGRTLFLSGQYLYDPAEEGFPWESFEVVRVPEAHWVLQVVPLGPSLTPSWTRGPFSDDELNSGRVPEDGTIERRDFDALKRAVPAAR